MGENSRLRLKRERNKSSEAAGLILQFTQLAEMIDAMCMGFHMAVKHGARAAPAHLMPDAVNIEPLRSGFFTATNLIAHAGVEDFRTAAGERTEAGFAQNGKRLRNGKAKNTIGQMPNLDRSKSFDVQSRIECAQA